MMTGTARKISQSGYYYHVTARGNGRQLIFEDDNDRLLLLESSGMPLPRVTSR